MELKVHQGWAHGLAPGTTHDINCIACIRERNAHLHPSLWPRSAFLKPEE